MSAFANLIITLLLITYAVMYYAGYKDGQANKKFKTFISWAVWIWHKIKNTP